ncbi:hypothetical protein ACFL0V_07270 [Nanoarchaeota archaeon]
MLKGLLNPKPRFRKPKKEIKSKTVPTRRFNDMIEYYTKELRSRLVEIKKLRQENEMLIKTSIKNAERADQFSQSNQKLAADVRILNTKARERK